MLGERSKQIRRDIIKLSKANGGYHYGGTFSCVEILIALFDFTMDYKKDRFILSKGHACWGLYVLLQEMGFTPSLEGHPHLDLHNGVHWTTGSEGHGLPAAVGMALARKLQNIPGMVYVVLGDGECQEGTTWESLLIAARHNLDNLIVIVDNNKIQGSAFCEQVIDALYVLPDAAKRAGWCVDSVDGHSVDDLVEKINLRPMFSSPRLIVANTIKGKGVSFMENQPVWHACWLSGDPEKQALEELA